MREKPANQQGWTQPVELIVNDETIRIPVVFHFHATARRLKLSAKSIEDVRVTVPRGVSPDEAIGFVRENKAWLREALEKIPEGLCLCEYVTEQGWISLEGKKWKIVFEDEDLDEKGSLYKLDTDQKLIRVNLQHDHPACDELWQQVLWSVAKDYLVSRVSYLSRTVSLPAPPVTVRDQSTLWGSCSSQGRINLNWRLILLEPILQDYVIYHELAHLSEMNHSRHFWDLLHVYDSSAGGHDRELNRVGRGIMNLGRHS